MLINKNWESKKAHFEFPSYTHDKRQVFRELQKLFYTLYDETDIYRKTWVFSSDIRSFDTKQLSLFRSENEHFTKSVWLEDVFQDMKEKYGPDVLKLGV